MPSLVGTHRLNLLPRTAAPGTPGPHPSPSLAHWSGVSGLPGASQGWLPKTGLVVQGMGGARVKSQGCGQYCPSSSAEPHLPRQAGCSPCL